MSIPLNEFQEHYDCEFVGGQCIVLFGKGKPRVVAGKKRNGEFYYTLEGLELCKGVKRAKEAAKAKAASEMVAKPERKPAEKKAKRPAKARARSVGASAPATTTDETELAQLEEMLNASTDHNGV